MARPAVFAELDFPTALAQASAEDKLLLVDATAVWCGPCQMMDRTTWVDPVVVDVIRARAIAIQLDVDAEQPVAKQLGIQAMPTVIAFRGGVEIDRITGARKSAGLIAWLDGLARGETALDTLLAEAAAAPANMELRMRAADMLADAGRLDEAMAEYVWLWRHMLEYEPAMYGVRLSFFMSRLERLAARHPPARMAVIALRDEVAPAPERTPERHAFIDWIRLNKALGESAATLHWFDAFDRANPELRALASACENDFVELLVAAERWADVGALYTEPLKTLAGAARFRDHIVKEPRHDGDDRLHAFAAQQLREAAALIVRALLAARRADDARAVGDEARRLDPSAEMDAGLAAATTAATAP